MPYIHLVFGLSSFLGKRNLYILKSLRRHSLFWLPLALTIISFDIAVAYVMSLYNITIELNQTSQHLNMMSVYLNNSLANIQIIAANQIKKVGVRNY